MRRDARPSGGGSGSVRCAPAPRRLFRSHPVLSSRCRGRMLLASAVVVWEWLNEHGRWRPYSPAVCHHIEAVIRSDPRCGSVVLGQVDSRLSPYIIDLHSMHQFRQDTGETGGCVPGPEAGCGARGTEADFIGFTGEVSHSRRIRECFHTAEVCSHSQTQGTHCHHCCCVFL